MSEADGERESLDSRRGGRSGDPQPPPAPPPKRSAAPINAYACFKAWAVAAGSRRALLPTEGTRRGSAGHLRLEVLLNRRNGGADSRGPSRLGNAVATLGSACNDATASIKTWSALSTATDEVVAERSRLLTSSANLEQRERVTGSGFGTELRRKHFPTLLSSGWFVRHRMGSPPKAVLDRLRNWTEAAASDPVWWADVALPHFAALAQRNVAALLGFGSAPERDAQVVSVFASTQEAIGAAVQSVLQPLFLPGEALLVLRHGNQAGLPAESDSPFVAAARRMGSDRGQPWVIECDVSRSASILSSAASLASDEALDKAVTSVLRRVASYGMALGDYFVGVRCIVVEHCNRFGSCIDPNFIDKLRDRLDSVQSGLAPAVVVDETLAVANVMPWPKKRTAWSLRFACLDRFAGCPAGSCAVLVSQGLQLPAAVAELKLASAQSLASRSAIAPAIAVAVDAGDHTTVRRHCADLAGDFVRACQRSWRRDPTIVAANGSIVSIRLPFPLRHGDVQKRLAQMDIVMDVYELAHRESASASHRNRSGTDALGALRSVITVAMAPFHSEVDFRRAAAQIREFFDASASLDPTTGESEGGGAETPQNAQPNAAAATQLAPYSDELAGQLAARHGHPPPPVPRTHEGRVTAMLARYDPAKVPDVRALLKANRGAEEELIDRLVVQHGPEPTAGSLLSRLESFFAKYDPAQLAKAPVLAERYVGSGCEVVGMLVKRYGVEPPPMAPCPLDRAETRPRDRLPTAVERLLHRAFHGTKRQREVPYLAARFAGRPAELESLLRSEGLLIDPASEKKGTAAGRDATGNGSDAAAMTFTTPPDTEEARVLGDLDSARCLRSRYLPTPALAQHTRHRGPNYLSWLWADANQSTVRPTSSSATPEPDMDDPATQRKDQDAKLRIRLERFYTRWAPQKVGHVPAVMEQWRGQEELLISSLVSKYGPEPHPDVPARPHPSVAFEAQSRATAGHKLRESRERSPTAAANDASASDPQHQGGAVGAIRAFYTTVKRSDAVEELVWNNAGGGRRLEILSAPNDYDVL